MEGKTPFYYCEFELGEWQPTWACFIIDDCGWQPSWGVATRASPIGGWQPSWGVATRASPIEAAAGCGTRAATSGECTEAV